MGTPLCFPDARLAWKEQQLETGWVGEQHRSAAAPRAGPYPLEQNPALLILIYRAGGSSEPQAYPLNQRSPRCAPRDQPSAH